jgi:hypothetical protein
MDLVQYLSSKCSINISYYYQMDDYNTEFVALLIFLFPLVSFRNIL